MEKSEDSPLRRLPDPTLQCLPRAIPISLGMAFHRRGSVIERVIVEGESLSDIRGAAKNVRRNCRTGDVAVLRENRGQSRKLVLQHIPEIVADAVARRDEPCEHRGVRDQGLRALTECGLEED